MTIIMVRIFFYAIKRNCQINANCFDYYLKNIYQENDSKYNIFVTWYNSIAEFKYYQNQWQILKT